MAALISAGAGIYGSVQSRNAMNRYNDALMSRMSRNDAKIAEAESPELSAIGQSYLTSAKEALKDNTDSLKGITAVNGGGLDVAKAKDVYSSSLASLTNKLYAQDYMTRQARINALEGYGNQLYNTYLSGIQQNAQQNAQAASNAFAGMASAASGAFDKKIVNPAPGNGAGGITEGSPILNDNDYMV